MVLEPLSNSSWNVYNMVLTMTIPPMYFCMFCMLISKSSLVDSCLSCSMHISISSRTWFLCLASVREPIDGSCVFSPWHPNYFATVYVKRVCCWWTGQASHSSRSTSRPLLCLALSMTWSSWASKVGPLCTTLSTLAHEQWQYVCTWEFGHTFCSVVEIHSYGKPPYAWLRIYHKAYAW